jgi:hypothetical protein
MLKAEIKLGSTALLHRMSRSAIIQCRKRCGPFKNSWTLYRDLVLFVSGDRPLADVARQIAAALFAAITDEAY